MKQMVKQIPGKQKLYKKRNIIMLYYTAQQWKMFHGHKKVFTNYWSNQKMRQYIMRKGEIGKGISVCGGCPVYVYWNHSLTFQNKKLIDT